MFLKTFTVCGFTAHVMATPPTLSVGTTVSVVPVAKYDPRSPQKVLHPKDMLKVTTTAIVLGQGAFGRCYLANLSEVFEISTGESVTKAVVKVIDISRRNKDQDGINLLKQELQANEYFSVTAPHPAIMKAYGMKWDERKNLVYLLLEYVPGVELREAIIAGLTPDNKKSIAAQHFSAIAHMHDHRYMHRDIKVENALWIPDTGKLLVFDFGLGMFLQEGQKDHSSRGTLAYAAPETIHDFDSNVIFVNKNHERGHDLAVDVWSMAVLVYVLYTKRLPFLGADDRQTIENIKNNGPWPIENQHLRNVEKFVNSLLVKDPDSRPTMEHIIQNHTWIDGCFTVDVKFEYFTRGQLGLSAPDALHQQRQGLRSKYAVFVGEEQASTEFPADVSKMEINKLAVIKGNLFDLVQTHEADRKRLISQFQKLTGVGSTEFLAHRVSKKTTQDLRDLVRQAQQTPGNTLVPDLQVVVKNIAKKRSANFSKFVISRLERLLLGANHDLAALCAKHIDENAERTGSGFFARFRTLDEKIEQLQGLQQNLSNVATSHGAGIEERQC